MSTITTDLLPPTSHPKHLTLLLRLCAHSRLKPYQQQFTLQTPHAMAPSRPIQVIVHLYIIKLISFCCCAPSTGTCSESLKNTNIGAMHPFKNFIPSCEPPSSCRHPRHIQNTHSQLSKNAVCSTWRFTKQKHTYNNNVGTGFGRENCLHYAECGAQQIFACERAREKERKWSEREQQRSRSW